MRHSALSFVEVIFTSLLNEAFYTGMSIFLGFVTMLLIDMYTGIDISQFTTSFCRAITFTLAILVRAIFFTMQARSKYE